MSSTPVLGQARAASDPPREPDPAPLARRAVARATARHALAWLTAGSSAGLLLGILLLAPRLGDLVAPFGYGRIAALHLDLTLYGWLALPWVGLLLHAFGADRDAARGGRALALWSGALAAGGLGWLGGATSGKLFLDWRGAGQAFLLAAEVALAIALLRGGLEARAAGRLSGARKAALAALWTALAAVPILLLVAAGPSRYPAIDPASGGATGGSLLGSSLGLVGMLLGAPRLLGLRRRAGGAGGAALALAWAAHLALLLALGGGDRGNSEPAQIAALASLGIWAVLLPDDLRRFDWPAGSGRWLRVALAWGLILVATGVLQFLPFALERLKFTHALVAHAHLAMAGFASAAGGLLLHARLAAEATASALEAAAPFRLWQGGLAVHLAALAALGTLEAADPAAMLRGGVTVDALLAVRALAGTAQLVAAALWWRSAAG